MTDENRSSDRLFRETAVLQNILLNDSLHRSIFHFSFVGENINRAVLRNGQKKSEVYGSRTPNANIIYDTFMCDEKLALLSFISINVNKFP